MGSGSADKVSARLVQADPDAIAQCLQPSVIDADPVAENVVGGSAGCQGYPSVAIAADQVACAGLLAADPVVMCLISKDDTCAAIGHRHAAGHIKTDGVTQNAILRGGGPGEHNPRPAIAADHVALMPGQPTDLVIAGSVRYYDPMIAVAQRPLPSRVHPDPVAHNTIGASPGQTKAGLALPADHVAFDGGLLCAVDQLDAVVGKIDNLQTANGNATDAIHHQPGAKWEIAPIHNDTGIAAVDPQIGHLDARQLALERDGHGGGGREEQRVKGDLVAGLGQTQCLAQRARLVFVIRAIDYPELPWRGHGAGVRQILARRAYPERAAGQQ